MSSPKLDFNSTCRPTVHSEGSYIGALTLIAAIAACAAVFIWLVPPALVMPLLSLMSFTVAASIGLVAYFAGCDRHPYGITLWDVAGTIALVWIAAGLLSEPEHVVRLFGL